MLSREFTQKQGSRCQYCPNTHVESCCCRLLVRHFRTYVDSEPAETTNACMSSQILDLASLGAGLAPALAPPLIESGTDTSIGTILVVDDLESNARLLERLLVGDGHRVIVAHDG